jgi:hypothetical protein
MHAAELVCKAIDIFEIKAVSVSRIICIITLLGFLGIAHCLLTYVPLYSQYVTAQMRFLRQNT